MNRIVRTEGFTLVELAVVILIVGVLTAGGLGAKQLRTHAALSATVADAQAYGAATAIFLDRYEGLPGDLRNASERVPGCMDPGCAADPQSAATGDGSVGLVGGVTRHQTAGSTAAERETTLFWRHLALSELVSGLAPADAATGPAWGTTHPAAPAGGGFHVKDADGGTTDRLPGWPPLAQQPDGTLLVLQQHVAKDLAPIASGELPLTAAQALWIDRKMDDGDPFDGQVFGYGTTTVMMGGAGCFTWTAADRGRYDETSDRRSCGLAFRIAP